MSDPLEARGRRAGAAVQERTAALPPDAGIDAVLRRGRRPRPAPVLAAVVALLVAVPLVAVVLLSGEERVELVDEPPEVVEDADDRDVAPTPRPTPTPERTPEPTEPPAPEVTPAPEPPAEPEATAPPEEDPDPPATGPAPVGRFGTTAVASPDFPLDGGRVAHLTDVRVGRHAGFDRVVLELDGDDVPSHRIRYAEPPIVQDGSGDPIAVAGGAFLEIILTPATGADFDVDAPEGYRLTYDGPDRVRGQTDTVTEVVRTGDFEATLGWVIGLEDRAPFAVEWLRSPLRLVIDVAHPGG